MYITHHARCRRLRRFAAAVSTACASNVCKGRHHSSSSLFFLFLSLIILRAFILLLSIIVVALHPIELRDLLHRILRRLLLGFTCEAEIVSAVLAPPPGRNLSSAVARTNLNPKPYTPFSKCVHAPQSQTLVPFQQMSILSASLGFWS